MDYGHESDESYGDLPPLIGAEHRLGGPNNPGNGSDDDEPPPLVSRQGFMPRQGVVPGQGVADSSSNDEDDEDGLPDLISRAMADSDSSDDGNDGRPYGRIASNVNAAMDTDDEEEEATDPDMPTALFRHEWPSSESEANTDDGQDQDREEANIPPPAASAGGGENRAARRRRNRQQRSRRGGAQETTTAAAAAAGSGSHDDDVPPLLPSKNSDSDSDIPPLMQRAAGNAASNFSSDSGDDLDDVPVPLPRNATSRSSSSDEDESGPQREHNRATANAAASNSAAAAAERPTSQAAPASADRVRLQIEIAKASKLRPSQLKAKLRELKVNINTQGMEKRELLERYAQAVVAAADAGTPPPTATEPATVPAPAPPRDPYADLPPLMSSFLLPRNGLWILSPNNSNSMDLEYAVNDAEDGSILTNRLPVEMLRRGSRLIPSCAGTKAFTIAPLPQDNSKWTVQVRSSLGSRSIKLYEIPFDLSNAALLAQPRTHDIWFVFRLRNKKVLHCVGFRDPTRPFAFTDWDLGSANVRLVAADPSGLWMHVSESTAPVEVGLWYVPAPWFSVVPPKPVHCGVLGTLASPGPDVKGLGGGVWALDPSPDDVYSCQLSRIEMTTTNDVDEAALRPSISQTTLHIPMELVHDLVSHPEDGGVILHYKHGTQWKLGMAVPPSSNVTEMAECPRHSLLLAAMDGGTWIWRKVGRGRNTDCSPSFLDRNEYMANFAKRYRPGTTTIRS